MIATSTINNLIKVALPSLELTPSGDVEEDFPPFLWISELTSPEAFVKVEIPGSAISIPQQRFKFHDLRNEGRYILESLPSADWPKITFELKANNQGSYQSKQLNLAPSSNTTIAVIKFTRVWLGLVGSQKITFERYAEATSPVGFKFTIKKPELLNVLKRWAKIYRKLGFLEKVFHHQFNLPSELLSEIDTKVVDYLFRGITEGEFTTRLNTIMIPVNPAEVDLEQPPWNRPGYIRNLVDKRVMLFGTNLDTGPIWLETFQAGIGSFKAIRQIEQQVPHPVEAPFALLDHQVTFRFERYANLSPQERDSRLRQYLHELSLEEPKSIYDLTLEPIANDVSEDEANHLATGWTQIHDLPDRYCSQLPTLDESGKFWRVPLWLTYPSGKGAPVADLLVDVKTGIVTPSIPLSEIRTRGKQLAHQLLHASETAVLQAGD